MSNFYLDLLGVNKIVDKINTSLRGRIKYKGKLNIIPTGKTLRTDWNDIAPCYLGHAYILTGTTTSSILIGGVRYSVGDMIFATNEVFLKPDGTVSANVVVLKISGSGMNIDNKTIVKNEDLSYADKDAIKTVVGGWILKSNTPLLVLAESVANGTTTFIKCPAKYVPSNGLTITIKITEPGGTIVEDTGVYDSSIFSIVGSVYKFIFGLDDSFFKVMNVSGLALTAGKYIVNACGTSTTLIESIHESNPIFIKKDNKSIYLNDLNQLAAKSAIEIDYFPDDEVAQKETLYRLINDIGIAGVIYDAGLYVFDPTIIGDVHWLKVGSTAVDEKTIRSMDDDGIHTPLYTQIGGWKELASSQIIFRETDNKAIGGTWTKTSTVDGDIALVISKHTIGEIIPAKVYPPIDPLDVRPFNLTYDGEITVGSGHYKMSSTQTGFLGQLLFYAADATHITIVGTFTGSRMCDGVDKTIEVCLLDTVYTYHSLDTKYIEKDNLTIISEEVTGHEVEVLRSKSAIEIASFPVEAKTETMYRLTQEVTIGDKKYSKGLYVYDLSDPLDPQWISVGGSEVDEKTIRTKNDEGAIVPLYTQIGGWLDKTDYSVNKKETTLTDTLSTYTFTDTKFESIWGVKAPAKLYATINDKDTGDNILSQKIIIAEVAGWENTFDFSDADIQFEIVRNPGVNYTVNLKHSTAGYSKNVEVIFTLDASVIHYVDSDYIKIDKTTMAAKKINSTDEVKTIRAKSAIEVDSLSAITDPFTETIYNLINEEIISGKKYSKGLYVYDKTGTDPVWTRVGGSEIDNKTILDHDDSGNSKPLHTAISGYVENDKEIKISLSVLASGTPIGADIDLTINGSLEKFLANYEIGDPLNVDVTYLDTSTKRYAEEYQGQMTPLTDNKYKFGDNGDAFTIVTKIDDSHFRFQHHLYESSMVAGLEFIFDINLGNIGECYHPIISKFINLDLTTTGLYSVTGLDTERIYSKSAIEITEFPTDPLTNVLYRLLNDLTIGTTKYDKGLYVYDLSTPATPKWLKVGGSLPIIEVASLPTTDIKLNTYYKIRNKNLVYSDISYKRIFNGVYVVYADGVKKEDLTEIYTWDLIAADIVGFTTKFYLRDITADTYLIQDKDIVLYKNNSTQKVTRKFGFVLKNESMDELYLFSEDKNKFIKIYPSEAIIDITSLSLPYKDESKLYRYYKKTSITKNIEYYTLNDSNYSIKADGVYVVATGVIDRTYAQIVLNKDDSILKYNLILLGTPVLDPNGCIIFYDLGAVSKACRGAEFKLVYTLEGELLYYYNKSTNLLEKIYPIAGSTDVVKLLLVTKELYEKIIAGTSTEHVYDKYTIYVISDSLDKIPLAYLEKNNIFGSAAIRDITVHPTGDMLNKNIFYRTETETPDFENIDYEKITTPGYTVTLTGVVLDATTTLHSYEAILADKTTYITLLGLTLTTKLLKDTSTIVFYTLKTVDKCRDAMGFNLTTTLETKVLIFSPLQNTWLNIYPVDPIVLTLDIDFNDPTIWYPEA